MKMVRVLSLANAGEGNGGNLIGENKDRAKFYVIWQNIFQM
jgi:hypothetical protein